jgi:hypothetical protein
MRTPWISVGLVALACVAVPTLPTAAQEVPKTTAVPRLLLQPQPRRTFLVRRAFVRRVPAGSTVVGRCRGPGCRVPAVRRYTYAYAAELTVPRFRGMRARPGTRIEILVSHPAQTGIVTVYKFGRAGVRGADCEVAPGSTFQDC